MRGLLLSDLHSNYDALEKLKNIDESFDLIFIAGDITNRDIEYSKKVASVFPEAFVIPGNNDPLESMEFFKNNIHERTIRIDGWKITGFGFSPPTPFGTPNEFSEEYIYEKMKKLHIDRETILLVHAPPFGYFDKINREHVGSKSILKIIKEKNPNIVLCGHIHETAGIGYLKETAIIKIPALCRYHYGILHIENGRPMVEFYDFR